MGSFASKRIGVVVGDNYQELEFWYPVLRFREMGATVTVVGADSEHTYRSRLGYPVLPDVSIADASAIKFDAIILSDGAARKSPNETRTVEFLTAASRGGAIMAALSTGVMALGSAGLLKGRRASASAETRSELQILGADCVAEPVVVDGRIITAESVDDIPAFFRALLAAFDSANVRPGTSV